MAKNLVIVESPAKAKTIEGFLGKDFQVKSCMGHIRDLSKDDDAVNVDKDYLPKYEIPPEKKEVVNGLKKLAKDSQEVWLATDEDREGEAISWHLAQVLGLDVVHTKRIVFHEITKPAILSAIENPRNINMNLVDAQQARRILDRLVGFELSPILWKKVKPSLSAGRVQSVAVRLIVEREREIAAFESHSSFQIKAILITPEGKEFTAELPGKLASEQEGLSFLEDCKDAQYRVSNLEIKPGKRSPAPPFTTSTLQQEASRKLGFPVGITMSVAQKLYEAGHITYMRTDSVNMSEEAIKAAKKEISSQYGDSFSQERRYANKISGAQEAHECIRPTYFQNHQISGTSQEQKLYQLIWKRALASQMSDALFERTVVDIDVSTRLEKLLAQGEVLKFEGFLKVYLEGKDDDQDEDQSGMLPQMQKGNPLSLKKMTATQKFTRPAPRYTEASLVKKMEELGIGRPSTYAPTISTILKRGYVVKEDREGKKRNFTVLTLVDKQINQVLSEENIGTEKAKLFPSDIGSVVTDFLSKHFPNIMDFQFTAKVEEEFDEIAKGLKKWQSMIDIFYQPFHQNVVVTEQSAEREKGERVLGNDPKTGKPISARIGRYGPVIQRGETTENEKPEFARLRKGQMIESITLEEALDLFRLPRVVGEFEESELKIGIGRFGPYVFNNEKYYSLTPEDDPYQITEERAIAIIQTKKEADANAPLPRNIGDYKGVNLIVNKGRFGPYVQFEKKYVSIPKSIDPLTITLDDAIVLIEKKLKADAEKVIRVFEERKDVQILNGRYGPYIAVGKQNVKIPKGAEPASLTLDDCLKLAKEQDPDKGKATKKAAPKKKK